MKWLISMAVVVAATSPALAGDCNLEAAKDGIREYEAYAKRPSSPRPASDHICMEVAGDHQKLKDRLIAACTTILGRDPKDAGCIEWSIKFGAKQLGAIDLFDKIGEVFPLSPFVYEHVGAPLYEKLDDPRALPLFTAAWTTAAADKRATQSRHMHTWTVWRHAAIRILGKHGGAAEKAFLEDQAKAMKDRGLIRASTKAIAAIDKRAAP